MSFNRHVALERILTGKYEPSAPSQYAAMAARDCSLNKNQQQELCKMVAARARRAPDTVITPAPQFPELTPVLAQLRYSRNLGRLQVHCRPLTHACRVNYDVQFVIVYASVIDYIVKYMGKPEDKSDTFRNMGTPSWAGRALRV